MIEKESHIFGRKTPKFRSARTDMLNKDRKYHSFEVGQIVHMYQARGSMMQTGFKKISCHFVRPLVIYKAIGPNQFLLKSLLGQIYLHLIEETHLKPGFIYNTQGKVSTLAELQQVLVAGVKLADRG